MTSCWLVVHPETVEYCSPSRAERVSGRSARGALRGWRGRACPWGASPQPVGAVRGDHKGEDAERRRASAPADRRAARFHARTTDDVSSAPSAPGACSLPPPPRRFPKAEPAAADRAPQGHALLLRPPAEPPRPSPPTQLQRARRTASPALRRPPT